jgi:hypothetical protein
MHIIVAFMFTFSAVAGLPKSFHKHEKQVEERERARLKAAKGMRKKRELEHEKRLKQADQYKAVRKEQLKDKERRQKKFESFEQKREQAELKRLKRAKKIADKKRNKKGLSWREQNKEFDISPPPLENKNL